ncbi:hypothetical protein ScPMuIL_004245 [Solemya velum]
MKLFLLLFGAAIIYSSEVLSKQERNVVNVAAYPTKLWKWKLIFFLIHGSFSDDIQTRIRAAMNEIASTTLTHNRPCIRFIERNGPNEFEQNYIYFQPSVGNKSCSSDVGMQGGQQDIFVDDTCWTKPQLMYHTLHALGLWDEHIRPDRDNFVTVHWDNIAEVNRNKFTKLTYESASLLGIPYDYTSLMHIGPYKYANDTNRPTLSVATPGMVIGQSIAMSANDVKKVQLHYHCGVDISHVPQPERLVDCSFERNICNMTNDPSASFNWTRSNTRRDHSNGQGYYVFAEATGNANEIARMVSPTLPPGGYCVIVAYSMSGNDTGRLEIVASDIDKSTVIQVISGRQVPAWEENKTNFISRLSWVLEISAYIGPSQTTGIAMDDVVVYRGPCL